MSLFRIRPAIVLFGDSITQFGFGVDGGLGWVSLLSSDYTRRADVLNRGFSGYNTNHALDLVPRVFGQPHDDGILFCTIFFGANDAALPGEPQHVPLDQYEENLEQLVDKIRTTMQSPTDFPIIFLTPPPVYEPQWAAFLNVDKSDRDNAVTRAYGERVKKVAAKYNCTVVDSWELLQGDSDDRKKYLSDGLHLNEDGNRLIHKGLMDAIQKNHPDIAPMTDGEGKYGTSGIPVEEMLWERLLGLK
jgi:lysophospholipase L1-like esterase